MGVEAAVINDRNIRYIIANEDLIAAKGVYKISLKAKHLALSEFTKNVKKKEAI